MKEVQKMRVSWGLALILAFGTVMLTIGIIIGVTQERRMKKPCANEHSTQLQPIPSSRDDSNAIAQREVVIPPRNPLEDIASRVERGITRERLERAVAELDDGRLSPKTVRRERVTLANGTSYAMEYWSWNLRMKKADKETWVFTLTLDLLDDKVVGIHYFTDYKVAVIAIHK